MDVIETNAGQPTAVLSPVPVVVPREQGVAWPRKASVFGVNVSVTNYEGATEAIIAAARAKQSAIVSCHAVHALITAADDPMLAAAGEHVRHDHARRPAGAMGAELAPRREVERTRLRA